MALPVRQVATPDEAALLAHAQALREGAARYLPIQNLRIAQALSNPRARADFAAGQGNVDASIAMGKQGNPISSTDAAGFNDYLARGRALSRIAGGADGAAQLQQLRDRVAMAKFGQGIRGNAYSDLAAAAGVTSAADRLSYLASQKSYGSNAAPLVGSLLGAGLRGWLGSLG